jgi:hypothetical protein
VHFFFYNLRNEFLKICFTIFSEFKSFVLQLPRLLPIACPFSSHCCNNPPFKITIKLKAVMVYNFETRLAPRLVQSVALTSAMFSVSFTDCFYLKKAQERDTKQAGLCFLINTVYRGRLVFWGTAYERDGVTLFPLTDLEKEFVSCRLWEPHSDSYECYHLLR